MRIGLIADIHGNLPALTAALSLFKKEKPDAYAVLGDHLGEGAYPREVLSALYALNEQGNAYFVRGNREDYLLNAVCARPGFILKKGYSGSGTILYDLERCTRGDLKFFASMPSCRDVRRPGLPGVTLCHGAPENIRALVYPDDEKSHVHMASARGNIVFCGHTHCHGHYTAAGKTCVNPGSLGISDEGNRAWCAIADLDGNGVRTRFFALPYDTEEAAAAVVRRGMYDYAPCWAACTVQMYLFGDLKAGHMALLTEKMRLEKEAQKKPGSPEDPETYFRQALRTLPVPDSVYAFIKENLKKREN